jgi:hypothetical protein
LILDVDFVATNEDANSVVRVRGKLANPDVKVGERLALSHRENKNCARNTLEVDRDNVAINLLTGCVPYLEADPLTINLRLHLGNSSADRRSCVFVEFAVLQSVDQSSLPNSRVADEDDPTRHHLDGRSERSTHNSQR